MGALFQILWQDIEFQWKTVETIARTILKEAPCNTSVMKTFDIGDCAGQIVVGVDASIKYGGQFCTRKIKISTGTHGALKGSTGLKL